MTARPPAGREHGRQTCSPTFVDGRRRATIVNVARRGRSTRRPRASSTAHQRHLPAARGQRRRPLRALRHPRPEPPSSSSTRPVEATTILGGLDEVELDAASPRQPSQPDRSELPDADTDGRRVNGSWVGPLRRRRSRASDAPMPPIASRSPPASGAGRSGGGTCCMSETPRRCSRRRPHAAHLDHRRQWHVEDPIALAPRRAPRGEFLRHDAAAYPDRMLAVVPVRDGVLPAGCGRGGRRVRRPRRPRRVRARRRRSWRGSPRTCGSSSSATFAPDRWAQALAGLVDDDVVVLPGSPDGRDLAPRLAHVLGRRLLAGAVEIVRRARPPRSRRRPRPARRRHPRARRGHAATGRPRRRPRRRRRSPTPSPSSTTSRAATTAPTPRSSRCSRPT